MGVQMVEICVLYRDEGSPAAKVVRDRCCGTYHFHLAYVRGHGHFYYVIKWAWPLTKVCRGQHRHQNVKRVRGEAIFLAFASGEKLLRIVICLPFIVIYL